MLKELLESKDYTVGFYSVEHYWPPTVDSIFDSYDYVRIYNPYLKGIWLDQETGLAYTLSPWGHFICQQTGEEKTINVNHLKRIEWECYYVHLDVLKENKVLKRFRKHRHAIINFCKMAFLEPKHKTKLGIIHFISKSSFLY